MDNTNRTKIDPVNGVFSDMEFKTMFWAGSENINEWPRTGNYSACI